MCVILFHTDSSSLLMGGDTIDYSSHRISAVLLTAESTPSLVYYISLGKVPKPTVDFVCQGFKEASIMLRRG